MKSFSMRSLACWVILAVEATNKNQEDCPKDGSDLQRLALDVIVTLHGYRALVHISTGATPLLPSIRNNQVVLPVEVFEVSSNRSYAEIQAWLNLKT